MTSSPGSLEGPLSKWTNVMKGWQFRWFVLEEKVGVMSYYTVRERDSDNPNNIACPCGEIYPHTTNLFVLCASRR